MNEHIPGTKIAEKLFSRPEGATMAEVVAATGGRQHNLLERLKARGYTVRSRKEGRTTRYWATRADASHHEVQVSSKGQITLPKEIRDPLGLRDGEKLSITTDGERIVLERKRTSLRDLYGMLHRPGMRPLSIEEMDEAIGKAVSERYLKAVGRRK